MPKVEQPQFVLEAEDRSPVALVDEICAQIDELAEKIDERRKWLTSYVSQNGERVGKGESRRLGRACAEWRGLKPSLHTEKALRYLARFRPQLLIEVSKRVIEMPKWNEAVRVGSVPARILRKLMQPAEPQLVLKIDPQT